MSTDMSTRATLLFVHGWAFDGSVWDPVRGALRDWPHAVVQAGYFDSDTSPDARSDRLPVDFDASRPFLVIGHSYGVMHAVGHYLSLPACIGIVSINGFARFSAADDFSYGVATRVLDRMLSRLETRLVDVVDDFRQRCGGEPATGVPQLARLSADLRALRDDDRREQLRASPLPLLALAGTDDPIVAAGVTRASFGPSRGGTAARGMPHNASSDIPSGVVREGLRHSRSGIEWLQQGGHLLPLTHAEWCATRIRRFIASIGAVGAPEARVADSAAGVSDAVVAAHPVEATPGERRNHAVGARFAGAVHTYDAHAHVQRAAAIRLAESIARLPLPPHPRILEIGCGTGFLTRELAARIGAADWTITDIAAPMLDAVRALPLLGRARFFVVDGEYPDRSDLPKGGQYDLICSSLAMQWFGDLGAGLGRLAQRLAPGGHLAIATLADGTFVEWQQAHRALGLRAATPFYPSIDAIAEIGAALPGLTGAVGEASKASIKAAVIGERHVHLHSDGMEFVRSLKRIGANSPAADTAPLGPSALKRVLAQFTREGASVTYHVVYGQWRKAPSDLPARPGVFVTGTDTGIGKTLTSAVLVRAWQAAYWKPLQSGLADETGDTDTVAALARLPQERIYPPAYALQASLSPWDAARLENVTIDIDQIRLPIDAAPSRPLVVEGAGGLYVPVDDRTMMIDLIVRFGLPVVLVARSGLGTINHTLLSLQALRQRGIPVLGVVMSGPLSSGNRHAIERFGKVAVLAEIPSLTQVDADAVDDIASRFPSLETCLQGLGR